jgi:O-antigen ligase
MIALRKVNEILLLTGLFFFSFNDYEGIPFLGEYKKEAGAIFFLFGFFLMIVESGYSKKISIPFKSPIFKTVLVFIAWCFITTILNLPDVINNYFKHTGGVNRFIRQYTSLIISTFIFFLFYWNVIVKMSSKDILFKIRKTFFLSLIVASIYGFLETGVVFFGMNYLLPPLKLFDYLPFLEVKLGDYGKISSICYEPPFLAIYLISIAGWMFSYILTEKGILKFVPTAAVLLLTFFSGSRTGLLVVFFQFSIFLIILYKNKKNRKYIGYTILCLSVFFSFVLIINGEKIVKAISEKVESLNFSQNLTKNVSNQSRFGMQYAALQVFKEHPIIGVGFGQQTYSARFHYPGWATKNNYEYEIFYKNTAEPSFPPGYNIYTRLLAELGLIGFLLFFCILFLIIKKTRFLIKTTTNEEQTLSYILLISFIGLFINWLQIDSFRMYCVWLCIAILIKLSQEKITWNE